MFETHAIQTHTHRFGVVSSDVIEQQKADRAKRFGLSTNGTATSTASSSTKIVDDVAKDTDKLKVNRVQNALAGAHD